uniref:Integrase, catalytic region, zinc finger, CCHC-type, peptidase aspartic, catalytic n=1 Tax=Tanacetum cinerariifolium TaxID=118510 RepID=A0A699I0V5_TANCI|nr:hypothetical protein [Tanacetum cinerariifolium]
MQQVQVNTKFLNALSSEWSKFVTDVKLAKSLYTTNYDKLYAYLSQHERHANEQGEDPIECINKAMAFLSALASRFPTLNNQLRTSFNPRNQETIQDGRVTVQQVQGRQNQSYVDPSISEAPVAQQTIPQNPVFQTDDLDAYDSNCDDLSSTKAVLMVNLSSCDHEVLSEVPYSDVQEMRYSEQTHVDDFKDNEIHSVEQMTNHVDHLDKENQTNKMIQPTLYDGSVIAKEHTVIFVIDDEETLNLEEESQSKMLDKQNDPISIEKKIKISPIDYSKLNRIKEDCGKHFVTQKELFAEHAFWLKHSSLSETPVMSHTPFRIKAPSELPKLNAQLQEKVYAITTLKNELRKLKRKNVVNTVVSKPTPLLLQECSSLTYNLFLLDLRTIGMLMKFTMRRL